MPIHDNIQELSHKLPDSQFIHTNPPFNAELDAQLVTKLGPNVAAELPANLVADVAAKLMVKCR